MEDPFFPKKVELPVGEFIVEQGNMKGFNPVAETSIVDSLLQSCDRSLIHVYADHLPPSKVCQLDGLQPSTAADVQYLRLVQRGQQPVRSPAVLEQSTPQFVDV